MSSRNATVTRIRLPPHIYKHTLLKWQQSPLIRSFQSHLIISFTSCRFAIYPFNYEDLVGRVRASETRKALLVKSMAVGHCWRWQQGQRITSLLLTKPLVCARFLKP